MSIGGGGGGLVNSVICISRWCNVTQEFEAERSEISRVKKSQKERVKELLEEEEMLQRDNKLLTRSLEEEKKCRIGE